MTDWVDLVARVRGLSTHLLSGGQLRVMAASRDLGACSVALAAAGVLPAPLERADGAILETATRRHAARHLGLVARWAGQRLRLLAPLFDDEDRRSIRAMVRGASSGSPPESRLAGLVPTPGLPERALRELAGRGDVLSVVAQLDAMSSPFASALMEEAARQRPELLRLECALNRRFAERAVGAGRGGDAAMRSYVAAILDVENAWTARLLPLGEDERDAAAYYVDGGDELPARVFGSAVTATTASARDAVLKRAATSSWLRIAVGEARGGEDGVLRALIAHQHALARRQPLGMAPIIEYVLRLRAELRSLQRIIWSVAMGAPGLAFADALEPVS